ncbi:NAD dependent epimerase/dehydratase family protein [Amniculicola lignicola CBS 123094]|uniref:NAD dependent epimerase/dehydratase family protein n=1 Tax=Amniculicola lignicola CBS 123094 TaxID=1392246 RepID=A0A6A5W289_9PLEO|nr:NAD dependent epimerase/dehydratase family protein [Amniculicola lignicola CBS 123094]
MPSLFITGATGYIGGEVLYRIATTYPDLSITALVRTSDKGAKVAAQFPSIRCVYGDLSSTDLITTEASKADIVVHTADCDDVSSANAIIAGMSQKEGKKGYLIHTSGTGILSYPTTDRGTFGIQDSKTFDDWDGIQAVTNIPSHAIHRNVDSIILASSTQHPTKIASAIICPPCIYGPGRGPDNKKSMQVYMMAAAALKRGKAFYIEEGTNVWTEIHVQDLSNVYLSLVEAALADGGKATWNSEGYYFAENGSFAWGDVGRGIGKIAKQKGLLETGEAEGVSVEEAGKMKPEGAGPYLWGTNSRCKAVRARKLFGWEPVEKGLFELLEHMVDVEARDAGLVKGHAVVAAGEA